MSDPELNPFAPPVHDAPPLASAGADANGVVRTGPNQIYVPRGQLLPGRCLVCNEPASRRMPQTLAWHPRWVYLLICVGALLYLVAALVTRKKMLLELPACETHGARRNWGRVGAIASALLGLVLLFTVDQSALQVLVGLVCLVVVPIAALYATTLIRVVHMTDEGGWFRVGEPYAASLPSAD